MQWNCHVSTRCDPAQKNQYQVGNISLGVPFLISVTVQLFNHFSCFGRRAARCYCPIFQNFKKEHPGHVSPMANGPCEPYVISRITQFHCILENGFFAKKVDFLQI